MNVGKARAGRFVDFLSLNGENIGGFLCFYHTQDVKQALSSRPIGLLLLLSSVLMYLDQTLAKKAGRLADSPGLTPSILST